MRVCLQKNMEKNIRVAEQAGRICVKMMVEQVFQTCVTISIPSGFSPEAPKVPFG